MNRVMKRVSKFFLFGFLFLFPSRSMLTASLDTKDVAINIDRIEIAIGDLGLAPDIWNLSSLPNC